MNQSADRRGGSARPRWIAVSTSLGLCGGALRASTALRLPPGGYRRAATTLRLCDFDLPASSRPRSRGLRSRAAGARGSRNLPLAPWKSPPSRPANLRIRMGTPSVSMAGQARRSPSRRPCSSRILLREMTRRALGDRWQLCRRRGQPAHALSDRRSNGEGHLCDHLHRHAGERRRHYNHHRLNPDPDGYTLTLDGGPAQTIGVSATYTFVAVSTGDHSVELGGLASPCVLGSPNPQTATVSPGGTATLSFSIDCTLPTINAWSPMTSGTDIPLYAVWGDATTDVFQRGISLPRRHLPNQRIHHSALRRHQLVVSGDTIRLSSAGMAYRALRQLRIRHLCRGAGVQQSGGSSFGAILHFDGQNWSMVSGPPPPPQLEGGLYTVSSSSATEVYAVGFTFNIVNGEEKATAIHFDGRSWSPTSIPGSDHLVLLDVWSKTESGAVAVGDDNTSPTAATGAFLRFDGTTWQPVSGAGNNSLKAVWGTSAADVFAVGDPPRRRRLRPKFPETA